MTNKGISSYGYGACAIDSNTIKFIMVSESDDCGVKIYSKNSGKLLKKYYIDKSMSIGNVKTVIVEGFDYNNISYAFFEGNEDLLDLKAKSFEKKCNFGEMRRNFKLNIPDNDFDWENDKNPGISYCDSIIYLMHTRGFTKHKSSRVVNKGTFLGIIEKIDYLKSLGVTCLELQPSYEFFEIPTVKERMDELKFPIEEERLDEISPKKLNYWGYKKGLYYMPKSSYCATEDCGKEFKTLIKALHKENIELVMQFYFDESLNQGDKIDILRYWVTEYHVDGFHIMGFNQDIDAFVLDPYLSKTKIWNQSFNSVTNYNNLALYKDDYMYNFRRFLKGDDDQIGGIMHHMRHIPNGMGTINYFTNFYGFTLMDLVSYDYKHNEDNGENNRDGNDYNCSWNCGEEGLTRKKRIKLLRNKQIKNALAFLFLAQGTPLIFMGDEFGNSQKGNNNPYCIDSEVTWLDWSLIEKNKEIFEFFNNIIKFRKEHANLHMENEPKGMDYLSCGYPDISFHGRNPWKPELEVHSRYLGIMYSGFYNKKDRNTNDDFIFITINMHWENHCFSMPKLPKGLRWKLEINTSNDECNENTEILDEQRFIIPPRSICIFKSFEVINEKQSKRTKKMSPTS